MRAECLATLVSITRPTITSASDGGFDRSPAEKMTESNKNWDICDKNGENNSFLNQIFQMGINQLKPIETKMLHNLNSQNYGF